VNVKTSSPTNLNLRRDAEARILRKVPNLVLPKPGESLLHELMHELRVNQVELEMQNEALRQAQIELEKSRDQYIDFYDFALIGSVTLTHDALIESINLPGAVLLGTDRSKLIQRRFATFVAAADQERWNHLFASVMKNDIKRNFEITLQKGHGRFIPIMLVCQRLQKLNNQTVMRVVLIDISDRDQLKDLPQKDLTQTAP
jgi:PAS domain-containing protein